MIVATRKKTDTSLNWQKVGNVENILLHRRKPLTESTLRLFEHGVNNGKQKALEKVFDASKVEILEGINRAREAKSVQVWIEAFKRMEMQGPGQLCRNN